MIPKIFAMGSMNSKNPPTLLEICNYIVGCNKKVKEIRVPKYTHLLIITTTFSLTIPSNFKGNIK